MELIEITQEGKPAKVHDDLPEIVTEVLNSATELYRKQGYQKPWIGYLAVEDGRCVGTCAFKTPPRNNEVEIAYFTFPEYEGRGVACCMASELIKIARNQIPTLTITAQTLPEPNASNKVLKKLGFAFSDEVEHPEDGRVWEWKLKA